MKKFSVIALDSVKENLVVDLMDLGVTELNSQDEKMAEMEWAALVRKDGNENEVTKLEGLLGRVDLAIKVLEEADTSKKPLFKTRKAVTREQFKNVLLNRETIEKEMEDVIALSNDLKTLKNSTNKIETTMASLKPWVSYSVPLELQETKTTYITMGVMPSISDVTRFKDNLNAITNLCDIEVVGSDDELHYLIVMYYKNVEEEVLDGLRQNGFSKVSFKDMKGSAAENLALCRNQLDEIANQVENIQLKLAEKINSKENIEYLHDELNIKKDRQKVRARMLKTGHTFYADGWLPEDAVGDVENVFKKYKCCYEVTEPDKEEEFPVLLRNNSFVTPFESVTALYSVPNSKNIDPTPIFAIWYFIFYGMMFSDAAYGLIMMIACGLVLKKFRLEGMPHKLVKMFFYCGLSTAIWGVIFGGYFGDLISIIGTTFFNKEISVPSVFVPLDDPISLLVFCLGLGIIHLFIGMGVSAYMSFREGRPLDAVFDIFSWYLLIIGLPIWYLGGSLNATVSTVGLIMTVVGAVTILLTGGRKKKGIGKITGGLGAIYGITGYLSDILSYSRLLALGLATGVIASVVNTMGSLAGGGILGAVILTVVVIFGHTFNFAINALGAFVHACRLQYVEFFGKFFEGGGIAFQPLKKNTKYVDIVNKN